MAGLHLCVCATDLYSSMDSTGHLQSVDHQPGEATTCSAWLLAYWVRLIAVNSHLFSVRSRLLI